jgi:hypothetical protein
MAVNLEQIVYTSSIPFDVNRVRAAALYCSDGRFGEQVDELLHHGLQLPRYDRLAVPGGAACLAGHFYAYREEEAVIEQFRFLLTVHQVRRVVLIAHENCAFYTERLRVTPAMLESKQLEDMAKAIQRVQQFGLKVKIDALFARLIDGKVCFEEINL